MKRYAVAWSDGGAVEAGRLDAYADRFELRGRACEKQIRFADVEHAGIRRGPSERLRGLPVLVLELHDGEVVRVASLQGAGTLHELCEFVERAELTLAP